MKVTYFALKEQMVGGRMRFPGDLVPEAADWTAISFYLEANTLQPVLVATLPPELQQQVLDYEGAKVTKNYPQSEAHRSTLAPGDVAFNDKGDEISPIKPGTMKAPDEAFTEKDDDDKDDGDIESYATQKKSDLRIELDHRGIAYDESDLKQVLIEKLEADDKKTDSDKTIEATHNEGQKG